MSLVATCDQWVRATHDHTAVEGADGSLTLSWHSPEPLPAAGDVRARGMATDRLCRIHHLTSDAVWRQVVGPTANGLDYVRLPSPVVIVGGPTDPVPAGADFGPSGDPPGALDPTGIAIDDNDRMFLADGTAGTISVLDLWSRRLLRRVRVAGAATPDRRPVGLAHRNGVVFAVLREPSGLIRLSATRGPEPVAWPSAVDDLPGDAAPSRVAVLLDGEPVVLFTDAAGEGWLVTADRPLHPVGPATDIAVDHDGAVVIAPQPGGRSMLRRVVPIAGGWLRAKPLDAAGYDGGGIVVTRDGPIAYSTADGVRLAAAARVDYVKEGSCTTYLLDSGVARNRWGRIFIEACVPDGTECLVATVTSDDEHDAAIAHVAADPTSCVAASASSPALPPPSLAVDTDDVDGGVHRRGRAATPWWFGDERFETLEAPVNAPAGRYLWVTLRLRGNVRRTPRVRELRVEQTAHALMRRLPGVFSAEPAQEDFLQRYLAMFDGMLHDLDVSSRCRDVLVDPHGTPPEALAWLASFLGLVLDDRWAEASRRQLVAEIVWLYRRRGTLWALGRYIEIFLAGDRATDEDAAIVSPVILEHFRLRGIGGALLGGDPELSSRSVLGAGFRVGGRVGELGGAPLDLDADETSPFASRAHRFTVLIPRSLSGEEDAAVRRIIDTERPAHTIFDLCTVDAGMRVGRGLHLGISSIVGPSGGFEFAIAGSTLLGRRSVLGPPPSGIAVEAARIGASTRVG
jgi:phage tail-like protein